MNWKEKKQQPTRSEKKWHLSTRVGRIFKWPNFQLAEFSIGRIFNQRVVNLRVANLRIVNQ